MNPSRIVTVTALSLSLAACGEAGGAGSDQGIGAILGTAAPLGYAGALSLAALDGNGPACVTVVTACATPPCDGEVTIDVATCALPVAASATGLVSVSLSRSSTDMATMIAQFVDVDAGGQGLTVAQATVTVTRSGTSVSTTYTDQDVQSADGSSTVQQSSWSIDVETQGTWDDGGDDVITITGAGQTVVGSDVSQVSITNAVMDPSCRLNPISGSATVQDVAGINVQQMSLDFHSTCDGLADIDVAVSLDPFGNNGSGGTVALDMLN